MRKLFFRSHGAGRPIALMILSSSLVGHARVRASDSEAIQGCYQARTGDLRVVQAPSDCRPDEVALSWNSAGTGPGSIAARVRDQGPFPLIPLQTTEVPLTGDAWSQGANEFQDVFGQVHVDTPCPSFAVAVVPLIKVFLDGELRVTMLVTQPVSDFRIPSFEPGVERSHTLAVTITHRGCTQAGEAIVQSVKADVLRVVPRVP